MRAIKDLALDIGLLPRRRSDGQRGSLPVVGYQKSGEPITSNDHGARFQEVET